MSGRMRNRERQRLWESTAGKCFYCRSPLISDDIEISLNDHVARMWLMQRDHKTPRMRGGDNSAENSVPACGWCNAQKNKMTRDEYHAYLFSRGIVARFLDQDDTKRDWMIVATVRRGQETPLRWRTLPNHPHMPKANAS